MNYYSFKNNTKLNINFKSNDLKYLKRILETNTRRI